jgi:hypothetical protein
MDTPDLAPEQLAAGRDFIMSLDKLGLHSSLGLWAYSEASENLVLILVTDFFDYRGPLEIYERMFKAYNATALPHSIDPFIVQFCSPRQILGTRLTEFGKLKIVFSNSETKTSTTDAAVALDDLKTHTSWILTNDFDPSLQMMKRKKTKTVEIARKWTRFAENVDKLAA